ncbi:hypothetical protein AO946_23870 [Pseudomonas aeruginosa]|nr:hypothetical protein AO946_23870 [Pseudomonas aeruginosa]
MVLLSLQSCMCVALMAILKCILVGIDTLAECMMLILGLMTCSMSQIGGPHLLMEGVLSTPLLALHILIG